MNESPPPLNPGPVPNSPPKSSGAGKIFAGCGIGCLVILIIGAVVGVVGFNYTKKKLGELASQYTFDDPVVIAAPQVDESEVREVVQRYDIFRDAMASGSASEPLVLSANEINALLFYHPDFKEFAGMTRVNIENDQLRGTVSIELDQIDIPVPFLSDAVDGKYFNGEIAVSIGEEAGHPTVFVQDLRVGGMSMPQELMEGLRQENLLKNAQSDPELRKIFEKVKGLKIENNRLVLIPAGAP